MARALELLERHTARNARPGAWENHAVVLDFGDPLAEYQAAQGTVALFDLSFRDTLRVTGDDRVSFLHGMVTQDIEGLGVGKAAYAALLTAKGAMVSDARVVRRPDDLLLDLEPGRAPAVKAFLERYLVSEDAEVHDDSESVAWLGLRGPATAKVLEASGVSLAVEHEAREAILAGSPHWLIGTSLGTLPGVDVLVSRTALGTVYDALLRGTEVQGGRPAGVQALEWLRVEAGVGRFGVDMDDRTLPMEANLDRALHFNKGCYIGQEVVARATYRGHVNRKLTGLLLGEAQAGPRSELRAQDKRVGWITSAVRSPALGQEIALGYVHRDFLTPGTVLTLAEGGASVTVAALPFEKRLPVAAPTR